MGTERPSTRKMQEILQQTSRRKEPPTEHRSDRGRRCVRALSTFFPIGTPSSWAHTHV